VRLANADIAVCIDNSRQNSRFARDVLRGGFDGFDLGPLQHGLDDGAKAIFLTVFPHLGDVRIKLLVLV
jgi:hypothetical protein